MGIFGFGKKNKKVINDSFEIELEQYLNENQSPLVSKIQLISPEAIETYDFNDEWKQILSNDDRNIRIKETIKLWKKYTDNFDVLIKLFDKKLVSIDSVLCDDQVQVIYTFIDNQKMQCYIGAMPLQEHDSIVDKLPEELRDFYYHIHNGFTNYQNNDMGPMGIKNFYCLGDDLLQSEFIEGWSVKDSYLIFSNGGGDGILFDVSKTPVKGFIYYHDDYDMCNFDVEPIKEMAKWIIAQL